MPDVWFAYALSPSETDPAFTPEPPLLADAEPATTPTPKESSAAPVVTGDRVDLLFRPHDATGAAALIDALAARLGSEAEAAALAQNDVYVAARLTFSELLHAALPLSPWWQLFVAGASSARRCSD